ncbi:hypothetical protein AB0J43_23040 [Nonomuraea fuscirosea]
MNEDPTAKAMCVHCEVEWMPRSMLEPGVRGWVRFQRTDSVLAEFRRQRWARRR